MECNEDALSIHRRCYSIEELEKVYRRFRQPKVSNVQYLKDCFVCSQKRAWNILITFLPVARFVSQYKVTNVIGDLFGGITVALLHIFQGISFAALAGLKPQHGLYTSFFTVLVYLLFGTSQYTSFGTSVIIAVFTRQIIDREIGLYISDQPLTSYSAKEDDNFKKSTTMFPSTTTESFLNMFESLDGVTENMSYPATEYISSTEHSTFENDLIYNIKLEVAMTASFLTGIFLVGFGILRLGFLTKYLSNPLIGGFTTAIAIHAVSMEVPKIFGIEVPITFGAGRLIYLYINHFTRIQSTVMADIAIFLIVLAVLITSIVLVDRYKSYLRIPIPVEVVLIVVGILASFFGNLKQKYNATVLGYIPSGFPEASLPTFSRASGMIKDCFIMAMISVVMSIAILKTVSNKGENIKDVNIGDNQEFIAYGISHIVSSFFSCFPQSISPTRTMLLKYLDAKTTLHAILSTIIMALAILWIGDIFHSLPVSLVSAITVVSLRDLLMQFADLPKLWKISKFDFLIWVITCLTSVFADLDYGILAGVCFSFISVVIQQQAAKGHVRGFSEREDIFVDVKGTIHVKEFPSVKMFMFEASINFANAEIFKDQLYRKTINPQNVKKNIVRLPGSSRSLKINETSNGHVTAANGKDGQSDRVKHVVINCQLISHVDVSGVNVLKEIVREYKAVDISVYLARCSKQMLETLTAADFFKTFPKSHVFYDEFDTIFSINPYFLDRQQSVAIVEETKL